MSVIAFLESNNGKISKAGLEIVSYAHQLAAKLGTQTVAVTYGATGNDVLSTLGEYGANKVLVNKSLTTADTGQITKLVLKAIEKENADVVIFSHDLTGRAVAPRIAARLEAGIATSAIAYPSTDGGFSVKVNMFSGKAYGEIELVTGKKVITVSPNAIAPVKSAQTASVEDFAAETGEQKVKVVSQKKNEGAINLPEAELVVSAGRGMKGPENWGMVEELANALGAATACSRPVADIGWRPHHEHVGQTGLAVAPNLYIAIGISGAIQHLAGVNRSKCIVVINSDPEAPFFKAADYGIVGDAFQVVPQLIEAAKKFKASHN
ncbi:MAG TPA: electron transfer flavoprotein subunit alpha/FixB family protein [Flavobacteriales bacterium]|nr:electron transfer flavoprotein subunit alpha/FixB family protein [Flavobacteriales bacterium]